jgi:hypothetical protein
MVKKISALTPKSQKILASKLNDEDLSLMMTMFDNVRKGICPVKSYQITEEQMIKKYGLKVR